MELQTKQPPELEFSMPEVEESLTAYLSAIGGAIIGLLLTLLVLAIWNGGTLNFTNISKGKCARSRYDQCHRRSRKRQHQHRRSQ